MSKSAKNTGYGVGSIVRIQLKNFLTYADVNFECGPRFNFVLGPNGSGKSSLVCAICLGLGGKPEILSRSPSLSGFVRHGQVVGVIGITLQCQKNQVLVQRVLNADNDRSDWSMNGKDCTLREVRELVDHLNIHVENLCNFLPQERVHAFAKLTSNEILTETMLTVAGNSMCDSYTQLIQLRNDEKKTQQRTEEESAEIKSLEQKNAGLKQEVERFEERELILTRIALMEKKRPWLVYEEAYDSMNVAKKASSEARVALDSAQHDQAPLQEQVSELKNTEAQLDEQRKKFEKFIGKFSVEFEKFENEVESSDKKVDEAREAVFALKDQLTKKEHNIRNLNKQLDVLNRKMQNPPGNDVSPIIEQLQQKQQEYRVATNERQDVERSMGKVAGLVKQMDESLSNYDHQIRQLQDIKTRKIDSMRQYERSTVEAYEWLQQNRNMFECEVFGPILLEVSIKDQKYTDAIETLITRMNQKVFVFQCTADYNLFMMECADKRKLKVNAVNYGDKSVASFQSNVSRDTVLNLGFDGYAKDFVDCSEPVMVALLELCNLHNVPISLNDVDNQRAVDAGVLRYIAGGTMHASKRAKYGNREISTRSSRINAAKNLTSSFDQEEMNSLTQKREEESIEKDQLLGQLAGLQANYAVSKAKEEALSVEKANLANRRKAILTALSEYQKLGDLKDILIEKIKNSQADMASMSDVKTKQALVDVCQKRAMLTVSMTEQIQKYKRGCEKLITVNVKMVDCKEKLKEVVAELERMESENRDLQTAADRADQTYRALKDDAKRAHKSAQTTGQCNEKEMSAFTNFAATLPELDAELDRERAKADLNVDSDPEVVTEYKSRQVRIDSHRLALATLTNELGRIKTRLKQIREPWEARLDKLMEKMSNAFAAFFEKLECVGQVKIHKEDDFAKWGVEILVKFRDEDQLMPLSGHRQSGGEKAVTIISYLMSLQYQSTAPFRVVDEINQGMDPRNERAVHNILVETVCNAKGDDAAHGQYFLITPKLLPDLNYHRDMRILVVYNGDFLTEGWSKSSDGLGLIKVK